MALLLRVLAQYKSNDVESAVKTLSSEEQDVLLKFIYKGFSEPSDSACGALLSWHEKVCFINYFYSSFIGIYCDLYCIYFFVLLTFTS